jgi:hypothetical protein
VSDIDTEAADSLKALDPKRPIREADMAGLAAGTTRSRMTIASVRHQKSLQRSASGVQLFRSLIRYSITSSAFGNVN